MDTLSQKKCLWLAACISLVLLAGACSSAERDLCLSAHQHLQSCFPNQDVSEPGTCDPDRASRILASSCDEIQGIGKADGIQEWSPSRSPWRIESVNGQPGSTSFALSTDSAGQPHAVFVSYHWETESGEAEYPAHLIYGRRLSASTWELSVVDSGKSLDGADLELDLADRPHITYFDGETRVLKYARWTGSQWEIQQLGTVDYLANYHSDLALDSQQRPHVVYHTYHQGIRYARWTGDQWETQLVDMGETYAKAEYLQGVGFPKVALDSEDRPHISYRQDRANGLCMFSDLKYARWTGSQWEIQLVEKGGKTGSDPSIALDGADRPHISYFDWQDYDLKYARWTGSQWEISLVDSEDAVGRNSSLALDATGKPRIAYHDESNRALKFAVWTGDSWWIQPVDQGEVIHWDAAFSLDQEGSPHFLYPIYHQEQQLSELRYARVQIPVSH